MGHMERKSISLFILFCCFFSFLLAGLEEVERCEEGWVGVDCSLYAPLAEPDNIYTGSLSRNRWRYFNIKILEPSVKVVVTLTQGESCDGLDLYVRELTLPTFGGFISRNLSDFTEKSLEFEAPEGFYYFGIFGFRDCGEFTLSYTVLSACDCATPQSGECLAGSNKCTCAAGYVGPKCSLEYTPSPSGQQNARSNFEGWSYYAIEVDEQPRQLRFELRKGGDEDTTDFLDMYVAANRPPFIHDYDYRTIGRSDQTLERILLSQPDANTVYFFAVHAIQISTFHVIAELSPLGDECLNQCSNHGPCANGICRCNPGFSGPSCEHMDNGLSLGDSQTGYADQGAWNYYWIDVDTATNAVVHMEQPPDRADCDLYLKRGGVPNFFNYDLAEFSTESYFPLAIPNPGGIWHIGVFGFLECEYTMSVHIEVDCNCAVNGHGMCQPGQTECICNQGWGGFDCNVPVAPLQINVPMKDQAVSIHSWTFYSFEVPAKCSGVTVAIRETNTAGSLWLYVNAKEAPTLISFDYTEQSTTSALHQIDFIPDFISENVLIIGVFANPYASQNLVIFDLVAWHTPF